MSDLADLLDPVVGDDEWSRHRTLERLRAEGLSRAGMEALVAVFGTDDSSRRSGARMVLAALAAPGSVVAGEAVRVLEKALGAPSEDVRVLAVSTLGEADNPEAGGALIRALDDPSPNVVAAAADSLGRLRHGPALHPLMDAARAPGLWVRASAVVALGRIGDERAIPALAEAARTPGLERPLVEALRRINHPDGLGPLARIRETAPREALVAAGAILAAHPDLEPPGWVVELAREEAEALRVMLVEEDDPAVARALGIAATPSAVETLCALVAPPRRSEAALTGLLAVPAGQRSRALLEHIPAADQEELVSLLSLLPAQSEPASIALLVPLLSDESETVRAAAAEVLARAPAERSLPLLAAELDRTGVAPEVVRALGGLGHDACAALLPLLADEAAAVRCAAAEALAHCGDAAIGPRLAGALEAESDPATRRALLRAVGHVGGGELVPVLVTALDDPDPEIRLAAIEGLGATGADAAIEPLAGVVGDTEMESLAAIRALGELGLPGAASVLAPLLSSPDVERRRAAARAAVAVAAELDPETLAALGRDDDEWVRVAAVRLLARHAPEARARLERIAGEDPSAAVRDEARRALRREG